jgi:hypothetical protein
VKEVLAAVLGQLMGLFVKETRDQSNQLPGDEEVPEMQKKIFLFPKRRASC